MNLAFKELADTKFEVLLCCCLSILNWFPLTRTNIFLRIMWLSLSAIFFKNDKLITRCNLFENWRFYSPSLHDQNWWTRQEIYELMRLPTAVCSQKPARLWPDTILLNCSLVCWAKGVLTKLTRSKLTARLTLTWKTGGKRHKPADGWRHLSF